MNITVAAIITPDMVDSARASAREFPDLELLIDVYHDPNEAPALLRRYQEQAEVVLFGGPIPYLIVHNHLHVSGVRVHQPLLFVPYTEVSLYRGLFGLMRDAGGTADLRRHPALSIDYPQVSEIGACLDELELTSDRVKPWECGPEASFHELIAFHERLWREGRTRFMLSSIYSVYEELKRRNLPVYRISPAKSQLHNIIHRAVLEGRALRHAAGQLAVGVIDFDAGGAGRPSAFRMRQRKRALADVLSDFEEQTQAIVDWTPRGDLRFFSTRGQLERVTDHFRSIPILAALRTRLGSDACMGIGFGRTAHEAEIRGREACVKARLTAGGACFLIDIDGSVEGPIGHIERQHYAGRSSDAGRLELARRTGLSVATINRLHTFLEHAGSAEFTALELAASLGITARSARRILGRPKRDSLVRVVGGEQPAGRGRPRQLYRMALQREPHGISNSATIRPEHR